MPTTYRHYHDCRLIQKGSGEKPKLKTPPTQGDSLRIRSETRLDWYTFHAGQWEPMPGLCWDVPA